MGRNGAGEISQWSKENELALASWGDRFWAWLIDIMLIGILWHRVMMVLKLEALGYDGALLHSLMLFIYWTALEGYRGQSLGKMVMNIAVTGRSGEDIGLADAAVESFGKAFLLPIDCLAAWIINRGSKQRLFNRISGTIVVRQIEE
ncbi:MAG TPA: RDD family protein [Methanothrix sp.]|nr:RDD family protein [Methanothrix sp.]